MANPGEVLNFLCPNVVWTINGFTYEDITWSSGSPAITKEQFEAGFAQYDAWKEQQAADEAAAKATAEAKLEALGLTTADLKALGL